MNLRSIDDSVPIQDRIRLYLSEFRSKEVPTTIEEMSSSLGLSHPQVYQGIKRLQDRGEIELEKEILPNRAERIVGIKLIRLEPSNRTYRRAADRQKRRLSVVRSTVLDTPNIPTPEADPTFPRIVEYLNKKLAIEELKEKALSAGLDETIIQFETNEIAEEAIALLQIVSDLRNQLEAVTRERDLMGYDLDAERRNAESYKSRLRDETREDLLAMARRGGD